MYDEKRRGKNQKQLHENVQNNKKGEKNISKREKDRGTVNGNENLWESVYHWELPRQRKNVVGRCVMS